MNKIDKFLSKIDKKTRFILEEIILLIMDNNLSMLDLKKLKGSNSIYRVRVGKIRIIFEHTKIANKITSISYRDDNTY
jgi:mRNA-degrading endonuclease RelE of RelBE toxin-antitoxin system